MVPLLEFPGSETAALQDTIGILLHLLSGFPNRGCGGVRRVQNDRRVSRALVNAVVDVIDQLRKNARIVLSRASERVFEEKRAQSPVRPFHAPLRSGLVSLPVYVLDVAPLEKHI
jgi:hypothetical protein